MFAIIFRGIVLAVFFVILWLVTPVFASFGTVWMPNFSSIVFFNGETGSNEADYPRTLYLMLRFRLIVTWIAAMGLNLYLISDPQEEEVNPLVFGLKGGYVGLFAFGAVLLADYFDYVHLIGVWMWWLGPLGFLAGFALALSINRM